MKKRGTEMREVSWWRKSIFTSFRNLKHRFTNKTTHFSTHTFPSRTPISIKLFFSHVFSRQTFFPFFFVSEKACWPMTLRVRKEEHSDKLNGV